jgi:hypothetical protein
VKKLAITLIFLTALLAPASHAKKIETGHDPSVDFSKFTTYAWVEGAPAAKPEIQRWIERSVERELKDRGLRKVEVGEADLHVKSLVLTMFSASMFNNYIGSVNSGWNFWQSNSRAYAQGAWVVDLIRPGDDLLVWRGILAGTFTGEWTKYERKIPTYAKKMFADFPPEYVPE